PSFRHGQRLQTQPARGAVERRHIALHGDAVCRLRGVQLLAQAVEHADRGISWPLVGISATSPAPLLTTPFSQMRFWYTLYDSTYHLPSLCISVRDTSRSSTSNSF